MNKAERQREKEQNPHNSPGRKEKRMKLKKNREMN